MFRIHSGLLIAVLALATMIGPLNRQYAHAELTEERANEIATSAYVYFYSLITMDVTRRQTTNIEAGKMPGRGPMNTFSNIRTFPTADLRIVVRPNFDTLYSSGWLDLTAEPMIVSAPDTSGRYYLLPMLDMWTDVFASPGKRTTGTKAENFAVVPPGWKGTVPAEFQRIDAPTPYVWVIGRTQTNGVDDYPAVHKIQDGFKITPLSQWGKAPQPVVAKIDSSVDMKTPPLDQVNGMKAAEYFKYAAELVKLHPPHITDEPIVAEMRQLGIEVGKSFDLAKADPVARKALEAAPAGGLKAMAERGPTMARAFNGWQMNTDTMGVYGTYYLKRSIVSMLGLGANLPEDAIYPMNLGDKDGKPLDGANQYTIYFEKENLPPVNAFWSITLYDSQGFQVANSINRFAIGDRDNLNYNKDGSLVIYIQNEAPDKGTQSNWLPAPKGPFNLTMRLYAPKPVALNGQWEPPPVVKQ